MTHPNLRYINLNLLPILHSLLLTSNVTRSAHMSQSAVSESRGKLGIQFNDDLLVKVGREMKPTPFALALQNRLDVSMEALKDLIQQDRFKPAELTRRFVVATADTVVLALARPLIDRVITQSPNVTVQFVDRYDIQIVDLPFKVAVVSHTVDWARIHAETLHTNGSEHRCAEYLQR